MLTQYFLPQSVYPVYFAEKSMPPDVEVASSISLRASEPSNLIGFFKDNGLDALFDQLVCGAKAGGAGSNYDINFIAHRLGLS
jgi:hypothetical protein